MRLSELKELRPDVWEIAKREALKQRGKRIWNRFVRDDDYLIRLFKFSETEQRFNVWCDISHHSDFTLMDKWIAENATT